MSIYVLVGDEVVGLHGPAHADGSSASCPLPGDFVRREIARAEARREGFGSVGRVDLDATASRVKFEDLRTDHLPTRQFDCPPNMLWSDISGSPKTAKVTDLVLEACARVGHEVYRAGFCDSTIPAWDAASERDKTIARVSARAALDGVPPETWFVKWRGGLLAEGWVRGDVLDEASKKHPNLVESYEELPAEQRALDSLFVAAVRATASAIGALEDATTVPVLKFKGGVSPEALEKFKREYGAQVAGVASAWKTPIVDAEPVTFVRPESPYTRRGAVAFVDRLIDGVLRDEPELWESPRDVEIQVLLLAEVRAFLVAGRAGVAAVSPAYEEFVVNVLGDCDHPLSPLSTQLDDLGRSGEFVERMAEFVASQRSELLLPGEPVGDEQAISVNDGDSEVVAFVDHLIELFAKHCECRPVNTARFSHSHGCDTGITDDIRAAIHSVVAAGPDDMTNSEIRAATGDEVRAALDRLKTMHAKSKAQS